MFARTVLVPEKRNRAWMAIRARQTVVNRKPDASTLLSPIAERAEWAADRVVPVRMVRVSRAVRAAVRAALVVKARRVAAMVVRLVVTKAATAALSIRAKIEMPVRRSCWRSWVSLREEGEMGRKSVMRPRHPG